MSAPVSEEQERSTTTEMPSVSLKVDPARARTLLENISQINGRIEQTCKAQAISKPIRLVAVSKLKPATDILALHENPRHLHFGENYLQELVQKSRLLPKTIRWHFIGGLQSNKCQQLARDVPNLWAVESVDSEKKLKLLNQGRGQRDISAEGDLSAEEKLRVFVQVNTSGEVSKSGVEPMSDELKSLCVYARDKCENLHLQGLMTIGAIARSKATTAETENEDFRSLRENRKWVADELAIGESELELSMGMSEDFEGAIAQGSDEVRVGSTIFGERPPKSEAKILEDTEEGKS